MASCRVTKCKEEHSKHYCRLCKEKDTNHFSSECPNSVTLYHGSHIRVAQPIARDGLNGSPSGRLGPGVYFVKTYDEAKQISKNRRNSNHTVVFKCKVYLGNHYDLGNKEDDSWQNDYDSACGIHPPWPGVLEDNFKEYCLKDPKYCVVKIIYIDDNPIKKGANLTWKDSLSYLESLSEGKEPGYTIF